MAKGSTYTTCAPLAAGSIFLHTTKDGGPLGIHRRQAHTDKTHTDSQYRRNGIYRREESPFSSLSTRKKTARGHGRGRGYKGSDKKGGEDEGGPIESDQRRALRAQDLIELARQDAKVQENLTFLKRMSPVAVLGLPAVLYFYAGLWGPFGSTMLSLEACTEGLSGVLSGEGCLPKESFLDLVERFVEAGGVHADVLRAEFDLQVNQYKYAVSSGMFLGLTTGLLDWIAIFKIRTCRIPLASLHGPDFDCDNAGLQQLMFYGPVLRGLILSAAAVILYVEGVRAYYGPTAEEGDAANQALRSFVDRDFSTVLAQRQLLLAMDAIEQTNVKETVGAQT